MKDLTGGGLDEALAFAKELNDDSLQSCLDRLKSMEERYRANGTEVETNIITDFAPYSFYFTRVLVHSDQTIGNGGIIFHGAHDRGGDGGAPTFSVNLTPTKGWAIHT